jgi:hypothetical protein
MIHKFLKLSTLLISMALSTGAQALSWNESAQGDLSNNGLAPSVLQLDIGINSVTGNFGAPDNDYLAITIPTGAQLIALQYAEGNIQGGVRSFIGVQAGATMTVLPTAQSATGLLGWAHYQDAATGTNLLPDIGAGGFGATGFTGPLSAGTYTFWIQDTAFDLGLAFAWDFIVTAAPVPEPETYAMLLAGLGTLGAIAKRRKKE